MNETIKQWLINLYTKEISEIEGTINNEEIWALGYKEKPNIHLRNITLLQEYLNILKQKLEKTNKGEI